MLRITFFFYPLNHLQISSTHDFAVCFGPVEEDGYGFCYNTQADQILVSASSFKPLETGNDPKRFIQTFADSMLRMQQLLSPV